MSGFTRGPRWDMVPEPVEGLDHRNVVLDPLPSRTSGSTTRFSRPSSPAINSGTIFRTKGELYQTVPSRPSGTGRENHHPVLEFPPIGGSIERPVLEFPDIRREVSRGNLSPPTGPTSCSMHAPKWDNRCCGFSKPSFPKPLLTKPAQ